MLENLKHIFMLLWFILDSVTNAKCLLVGVPKFCNSGMAILVNISSLKSVPLKFSEV